MVLVSLSAEKRLQSRRAVKRIAKNVRASIRSPRWYDINQDFWLTLEKSQQDDFSRICSRKLLLIRLQIKEVLRGLNEGECSIEDLISNTRLNKESVLTVLRKHGYGVEQEDCGAVIKSPGPVYPPKGNVTFDLPVLDISDVRREREKQRVVEEVTHDSDRHTPLRNLDFSADVIRNIFNSQVEDTTIFIGESPREVTDSSAEISDLAKRLGARLCQERSLVDQLRNIGREKPFVEQLPKPTLPVTIHCKETDVQTSIRFEAPIIANKETRDNATDLPSLDCISMSERGALQQLAGAFIIQEDVSSSAVSSDQSAGQIPESFRNPMKTTISIAIDGSAQLIPSETISLSRFFEEPFNSMMKEEACSRRTQNAHADSVVVSSPRIPRVHESPWRPSSRRLHIDEVDISTSQDSDSLEVISVATSKRRLYKKNDSNSVGSNRNSLDAIHSKYRNGVDESGSELVNKEDSDSSHQDDEHTCNQVSQIVSE
uniref:MYND-type domain-containing protein n=1 Tax=Angiostrongylus cantonensis TaxID=6313 RepID=A0A0K0CUE3_ANGCA